MTVLHLRDNWILTVLGENVYNIPNAPIDTKVPSTVYGTLLEKGLMPDPYYRDNELKATRLMENDFAYETTFTLDGKDREADRLFLRFDGIDTLADVYLDGELLGTAYNMNRVWEYDITARVKDDEEDTVYHLKVVLHSPTRYISQENERCPVGGSTDAMPGFSHLRKAACMFGWDWGPRLPDAGLFREVTVQRVKTARIAPVYIPQQHEIAERTAQGNRVSSVRLTADAEIEWMPEAGDALLKLAVYVTGPEGAVLSGESGAVSAAIDSAPSGNLTDLNSGLRSSHVRAELTVSDPQLWWPNGYGEQPLYRVEALLVSAQDARGEAGVNPCRDADREDSGKKSFKERYLLGQCGMDGLKPEMESMRREMQPEEPDTESGRDGGSRAAESLGLTAEEYAVFCHDGAEALERMLDAQKQRCCFKVYQLALDGGETVPFAFKGILELYRAGYEQPPAAKYKLAADTALVCPDRWKDAEILKHISVCLGGDISEKDGSCMEHPLAPSDVVELRDEAGRRYFYVDGAGLEPVRFSPFLAKPMDKQGQDRGASDVRGCLKK